MERIKELLTAAAGKNHGNAQQQDVMPVPSTLPLFAQSATSLAHVSHNNLSKEDILKARIQEKLRMIQKNEALSNQVKESVREQLAHFHKLKAWGASPRSIEHGLLMVNMMAVTVDWFQDINQRLWCDIQQDDARLQKEQKQNEEQAQLFQAQHHLQQAATLLASTPTASVTNTMVTPDDISKTDIRKRL